MVGNRVGNRKKMSFDMVYVPVGIAGHQEFKNAHIDIEIVNDKLEVTIESNNEIANADLEVIVNKLQAGTFSKMKVSIAKDCSVFYKFGDKKNKIEIENGENGLALKEN